MNHGEESLEGFVRVTQAQFFNYINPLDVNPSAASPDYTDWRLRSGVLVGRSLPGWRYPAEPYVYTLVKGLGQ